jgi:Electron transfer DM13
MATDVRSRPEEPQPPQRRRTTWPTRLLVALPGIVGALIFGFFVIDKSSEASTAFESTRALVYIGGIIVGWVVLSWLLKRLFRPVWVRSVVMTALTLLLAILFVRPYYVDEVDNTRLVSGRVQDASDFPATSAAPAAPPQPGAPATSALAPAPPAGPVRVSAGGLQGLDHDASGEASIIRLENGSHIVRFSNFDIEGSPGPKVYLVDEAGAENPDGAVGLGDLRGNVGDASDYEIPAGTEPGPGWTVLVWCEPFGVPIANATQNAV